MYIDEHKKTKIREVFEATIDIDDDIARVCAMVARLKAHYPNMTATELGGYMAEIVPDHV